MTTRDASEKRLSTCWCSWIQTVAAQLCDTRKTHKYSRSVCGPFPLVAGTSGLHICLVDTWRVRVGSVGRTETWLHRARTHPDTHLVDRESEREEGWESSRVFRRGYWELQYPPAVSSLIFYLSRHLMAIWLRRWNLKLWTYTISISSYTVSQWIEYIFSLT